MIEGLRWGHVRLITSYWVRFSVRTGSGLLALFFVLTVGLTVAAAFISPVEELMKKGPEVGHSELETVDWIDRVAQSDTAVDVVKWVTGDADQAEYLLKEQPALLSVIFILLLMLFPFTVCLAGFNQTAGEIGNGGLRFLLLRTERPNVFLGRFLGAVVFTAIAIGITFAVLYLYVTFKFRIYGAPELALWSLQGYAACLFLSIPYLALCAWMSGMLDSAFGSLALCELVIGFPILFFYLADLALAGDQAWLRRLLPWGWKFDLIAGDLPTRAVGYGMMLVFTGVFLALGLRVFAKRDL